MKIFFFILSFSFLILSNNAFSQNYEQDALRFSQAVLGGSSRIQGLGGAQTSLGGDISNVSGNPAGLGFFRRSEFSFTAGLNYVSTKSTYIDANKSTPDNKFFANAPNLGVVFSWAKDDIVGGKGRGGAFGISFNRMSSFQNKFSFSGVQPAVPDNSFLDFLAAEANGKDPYSLYKEVQQAANNKDFETLGRSAAAYNSFLINPIMDKNNHNTSKYYRFNDGNDADNRLVAIKQSGSVTSSGGSGQWNLSYGGNYNNRFYFGASLGVPRIRYQTTKTYLEEFDLSKNINNIDNYTYAEDKTVTGTGINIKGGFIYRINNLIRLGISGVSPSYVSMKETYTSNFVSNFPNVSYSYYSYTVDTIKFISNLNDFQSGIRTSTSPNDYKYTLTQPGKVSGGLSIFVGKHGFFTGDIDYVPYKSMRITGDGLNDINTLIQNTYKNVFNLRVGFEGRFDIFRARLGFAYLSDPYKNPAIDRSRMIFTAGAGLRHENFYFDITGTYNVYKSAYSPYGSFPSSTYNGQYASSPSAFITNTPVSILATVGFRFN